MKRRVLLYFGIFRDVKPDNILLDEKGNAHLTDFNIAVHFSERRALTSIAGSMAYMAPEVLLKKGYTYTVDWWSLGVTGWELLFGKRPFRGKTNSALTSCILKDTLRLPENKPQEVGPECMSFLKGVSRLMMEQAGYMILTCLRIPFISHCCSCIAP